MFSLWGVIDPENIFSFCLCSKMAGYYRYGSLPARLQRGKQQAGKYRVRDSLSASGGIVSGRSSERVRT